MICPQLKQNLETIKTLKSELDLELAKLESIFKVFKNNSSLNFKNFDNKLKSEFKKDCTKLMDKIKEIKTRLDPGINELTSILENPGFVLKQTWKNIYKKWFNKDIEISSIKVPEDYNPEKHFGLIIPGNLTLNEVVKAMKKKFKERGQKVVFLYNRKDLDLDATVTKNDRPIDKSYAILFKNNIEADEDLKNLSAYALENRGIKGITLKERLLMEIFYFAKTGKHLDNDKHNYTNRTLCSGSRYSGGYVPNVYWRPEESEFILDSGHPGYSNPGIRARSVVSGS
jgi:hypothetical protein